MQSANETPNIYTVDPECEGQTGTLFGKPQSMDSHIEVVLGMDRISMS